MPRKNSKARKVHRGPSSTAYLAHVYGAVSRRERARIRRKLRDAREVES